MKTAFLLCWLCPFLLNLRKPVPTTKPLWTKIYNNRLLDLTTAELTLRNLYAVYKGDFHVGKISKNKYEPNVRDTLLVVNTATDKIKVFKNKYNTFLLSAALTSQRLAFGRAIRIGTTKAAFCKAFGLSPKYDGYQIIENPEGGYELDFYFKDGVLSTVTYQVNYVE